MKPVFFILIVVFAIFSMPMASANTSIHTKSEKSMRFHQKYPNPKNSEAEVIELSKKKWLWMAGRNIDSLSLLFHDKAVFVHMGATFSKEQELGVIKTGSIQYKEAVIHEVSVRFIGHTAILLNKIRLDAIVGGNAVSNPFMVAEVYIKENGAWKLGSLSFTRLVTQ